MLNQPIVFLDFDGVLSPGLSGTLIYRHAFSSFLQKNPELNVVFSTNWRLHYSLADLCSIFPAEVHHRILGVTPDLESSVQIYLRENEIQAWRKENKHTGAWVALDDEIHLFSDNSKNLVWCDPARGIREKQFLQIVENLERLND